MADIILLNKPFYVLCQFTDDSGRQTLADYISQKGFYPAGRLDYDSEGLVLLTNDGALQARIANPKFKLNKLYWVQVEGDASPEQIAALNTGVMLKDGFAKALKCQRITPPAIWPRNPPIRERNSIPTSWLAFTLNEGRNRQVRRMTAAVGLPTLRLIRAAIGNWRLDNLPPGESRKEKVHLPPTASPTTKRKPNGR